MTTQTFVSLVNGIILAKLRNHRTILLDKNMTETQLEIAKICEDVKELLLYKNLKYGNSALNPIRVFSSSDNTEQLLVRIDDKLNRIKHGENILYDDEDVIQDLIGYLVLLKISLNKTKSLNKTNKKNELQQDN